MNLHDWLTLFLRDLDAVQSPFGKLPTEEEVEEMQRKFPDQETA